MTHMGRNKEIYLLLAVLTLINMNLELMLLLF